LPYCERCGAEHDENAAYCPKCGATLNPDGERLVELATWTQRFIALMIDGIILAIIVAFFRLPGEPGMFGMGVRFGVDNIIGFLYFMFMDQYYGQSVGKKVMNLRVTKVDGRPLELMDAAIEAFGKVFLLPIDFLIGFFMFRDMNQRLFNHLSDTVVVREM
jgi:uncharacterized RDD family membrane protein YckC